MYSSSPRSSPRAKRLSKAPSKYTPSSPNNGLPGPRYSDRASERDISPTKSRSPKELPSLSLTPQSTRKRKRDRAQDTDDADDERDPPAKLKQGRKDSTPTKSGRKLEKSGRTDLNQTELMRDTQTETEEDQQDEEESADKTALPPIPPRSKHKRSSEQPSQNFSVIVPTSAPALKKSASAPSSARTSRSASGKSKEKTKETQEDKVSASTNVSALLSVTSSDLYFQAHRSSKAKKFATSSNLISNSLGTLSSTALEKVSSTTLPISTSPFAPSVLHSLVQSQSRKRYRVWDSLLITGHSLIFYGIGEKSKILQDYLRERAESGQGNVCVIRGHMPGLRIESVLDWIEKAARTIPIAEEGAEETIADKFETRIKVFLSPSSIRALSSKLGLSSTEARALAIVNFLEADSHADLLSDDGAFPPPLYLLFNNLDSPTLTSRNSRKVINILATSHRIRLLGTVDHWSCSLLVGAGGSTGLVDEFDQGKVTATSSVSYSEQNETSSNLNLLQDLPSKPSYLQIHLSTYLPPTSSIQLSRPGVRLAGLPKVLVPAGGIGQSINMTTSRRSGAVGGCGRPEGPSAGTRNNHQSQENQLLTFEAAKHTLAPIPERALRMFRRLVEATFKKIEAIESRQMAKNPDPTSSNPTDADALNISQSQLPLAPATAYSFSDALPSLSHSFVMRLAAKEFIMQESTMLEVLKEPLTHGLLLVRDGIESSSAGGGDESRPTKLYEIKMSRKELKELVEHVSHWPRWRYTSEMT